MKLVKSISLKLGITVLIFAWVFSGYPQIWQKPSIPPEIQIMMSDVVILKT